ncbi:MAG: pilus assembly protein [Acidobacteria bacterium]|nr:pilus assembly protein [Acidobacteriota bacterium]MBV8894801.1 pilus assembly protein [Acidobacteriota bacterium]MBV9482790.1 pilus assembly protein [Acidobacteriota bacterium]
MSKLFQVVADSEAQEIAELAVVLPILLTLIFGIFSFARAYNIYSTVTRAAEAGARTAVAPLCATCTANTCTQGGSSITTSFPCDTTVAKAVTDALSASHLDPGQVSVLVPSNSTQAPCPPPAATSPTCTTASNISICRDVLLNVSSQPPACGTVVSFQYQYKFIPVPFLTFASMEIPAQAQVREEF